VAGGQRLKCPSNAVCKLAVWMLVHRPPKQLNCAVPVTIAAAGAIARGSSPEKSTDDTKPFPPRPNPATHTTTSMQ
jgi:hypothetical protein